MKIAIVGYGIEGKSVAEYFGKRGADITVCDIKKNPEWKGKHSRFGAHYLDSLKEFDLIFRSPGIPYLKKKFNPVRKKLTSLTKYFFEKCPCPIIGITGTKGKGTTATLIYEMLKGANARKVFLGGNIGSPPLKFLDELTSKDLIILELSSFQLQDLNRSPHIAVVLGITPDHLDHHENMEEYINAKKNIARFQKTEDYVVLDADNEHSNTFSKDALAKILKISTLETVQEGAFLKVGSFVIKTGKTGLIFGEKGHSGLIGDHNIKNILAAALVAHILEVPIEIITKVVREFRGLPHRLEFVRELNGIKFYNDSASTNPDTAIAALRTFHAPTILIAGGFDKNVDFAQLGNEIAKRLNVKTVVTMGETKGKIEAAIETACAPSPARPVRRRDTPLEIISAENYQEAFMAARLIAEPGDIVLLSPGCASFGMFRDHKERGEIFRNFVMSL